MIINVTEEVFFKLKNSTESLLMYVPHEESIDLYLRLGNDMFTTTHSKENSIVSSDEDNTEEQERINIDFLTWKAIYLSDAVRIISIKDQSLTITVKQ